MNRTMSLFNAMKALKVLGNMESHKEVIIKTPLTTTIEGPANSMSEIPQPHGIPMSMELYEVLIICLVAVCACYFFLNHVL